MARVPPAATDWSATALHPFNECPWYWQLGRAAAFDAGPGKRSGEGSLTVRPFLVKALAGKRRPDDLPEATP